jgi:AcrR family transcriptional regulator
VRNATVAEIKQRAWAQVAEGGASAVSLRAIARQMGMTSSALYRYFDSHEQLLRELVTDGFASLADTLEAAESENEDRPATAAERFTHVTRAHRRWALEHQTEYALIFGTSMRELKHQGDLNMREQHRRGVAVLFRVMLAGLAAGELDPNRLPALRPELEAKLTDWRSELELPFSPEALAGCLFAWTQLHGSLGIELFGHLPPVLMPGEELFDQNMRSVLLALGCKDAH